MVRPRLPRDPRQSAGKWYSAPWFEETILTNSPHLQHLHGLPSPVSAPFLRHSRVAPHLNVIRTDDMADAARASVSDMFYFPCHQSPHGDFLGGVTDLFPVEIRMQRLTQLSVVSSDTKVLQHYYPVAD